MREKSKKYMQAYKRYHLTRQVWLHLIELKLRENHENFDSYHPWSDMSTVLFDYGHIDSLSPVAQEAINNLKDDLSNIMDTIEVFTKEMEVVSGEWMKIEISEDGGSGILPAGFDTIFEAFEEELKE